MNRNLGAALLAVSLSVLACKREEQPPPPPPPQEEGVMPTPRALDSAGQAELTRVVQERFGQPPPAGTQTGAAGPFRVLTSDRVQYLDRSDVGSIVYERADYGVAGRFDSSATPRAALLSRIDSTLRGMGFETGDLRFVGFQDEFAGAGPRRDPRGLSIQLNPGPAVTHVARTAEYARTVNDVPVFGSELIIGFMPDGRIGRLRRHWPTLEPRLMREAQELRDAVRSQTWRAPAELDSAGVQILEVSAGVGHSGIADPGFRAAAVVRVTYRRTSGDSTLRTSSTGHKYYDRAGREVRFMVFPSVAGTPDAQKQPAKR